jgi:flagellar biosynthetic protein FliR
MAPVLTAAFAVFLRVGGLMLLLPGLGDRSIPARVRLLAAFALTAAVAPAVPAAGAVDSALILSEGAVGLALGAALRFAAQALIMAGMMAAQLTSLSQLFGTQEPSSAIGNLLNWAGLCLLMAAGLPLMVVEMLVRSYDMVPMGAVMPGADAVAWGVGRLAGAFGLALALAAPFALAALLYNLALGVVNRAMPQLMVALVGAPAITFAAGVVLLLAAPVILTVWQAAMTGVLADPLTGVSR